MGSVADKKPLKCVCCGHDWSSRECVVDRQLTAAASRMLLGLSSPQLVANAGSLCCLAPRRHSHLCTGVPSSRLLTSQHHSTAPTSLHIQAHRPNDVDAAYLTDIGTKLSALFFSHVNRHDKE